MSGNITAGDIVSGTKCPAGQNVRQDKMLGGTKRPEDKTSGRPNVRKTKRPEDQTSGRPNVRQDKTSGGTEQPFGLISITVPLQSFSPHHQQEHGESALFWQIFPSRSIDFLHSFFLTQGVVKVHCFGGFFLHGFST
jgi:hypothetical protein